MKKTLVTALTTALVVGAASTTFAAANPFSDVPMNHWAYDAVAQLADDGVIDGYGDGTFRGDRNITRYEMAQMVARAMANDGLSASDRALVDRLAAEFADELTTLGVRVANLERNADKVKWTGELRYRYWNDSEDNGATKVRASQNQLQLRLFPTAEVNKNWKVKARLTSTVDMDSDASGNVALTYAFAEGTYGSTTYKFGKMPLFSTADHGLVVDDFFSGAAVTFGKKVKVSLEAGRFDNLGTPAADYQGIDLGYKAGKLDTGVAYRLFDNNNTTGNDDIKIFSLGAKYQFDKNLGMFGAYAENTEANAFEKAGRIGLAYKGAKIADRGSWGASLTYRHMGNNVALVPTDAIFSGVAGGGIAGSDNKGWEIMAQYVPFTNTRLELGYFDGERLTNDNDVTGFYTRMSWFF